MKISFPQTLEDSGFRFRLALIFKPFAIMKNFSNQSH